MKLKKNPQWAFHVIKILIETEFVFNIINYSSLQFVSFTVVMSHSTGNVAHFVQERNTL